MSLEIFDFRTRRPPPTPRQFPWGVIGTRWLPISRAKTPEPVPAVQESAPPRQFPWDAVRDRWFPLNRTRSPEPEPAVQEPIARRLPFPWYAPPLPWIPGTTRKRPEPEPLPVGMVARKNYPAGLFPGFRSRSKNFIPWNHAAEVATRKHEQLVSELLNSLILGNRIVQTAATTFDFGYQTTGSSWAGAAPTTVAAALDRIAAALVTLGIYP